MVPIAAVAWTPASCKMINGLSCPIDPVAETPDSTNPGMMKVPAAPVASNPVSDTDIRADTLPEYPVAATPVIWEARVGRTEPLYPVAATPDDVTESDGASAPIFPVAATPVYATVVIPGTLNVPMAPTAPTPERAI